MIRYKLVRIVNGEFKSANPLEFSPVLTYKIGEETKIDGLGVAYYKTQKQLATYAHLRETMMEFNSGNPIAILKVKTTRKRIACPDDKIRYVIGGCYEGGVNYESVLVKKVVKIITQEELSNFKV